jgi:hypothetical protein
MLFTIFMPDFTLFDCFMGESNTFSRLIPNESLPPYQSFQDLKNKNIHS